MMCRIFFPEDHSWGKHYADALGFQKTANFSKEVVILGRFTSGGYVMVDNDSSSIEMEKENQSVLTHHLLKGLQT